MALLNLDPDLAAYIKAQAHAGTEAQARIDAARRRFPTPGALAKHLDPTTQQTAALDQIDAALMRISDEPGGRLIVTMPPQQGKSTRISQVFPAWALMQDPNRPIMIASYGEQLAERNGAAIRDHIAWNDLGITIDNSTSAKKRWRLAGYKGGALSVGIGSGATGWASGLTIIDDPVKDQQEADSKTYRDRVHNWWLSVAQTRLAPGAPVVVVLTRWHEDDLAGRLLNGPDKDRWQLLNIPAQACHNPDAGETDPLGREPGEYLRSARLMKDPRTGAERPMTDRENRDYWEAIKIGVGSRTWEALYQGNPRPGDGGTFQRAWFENSFYTQPLWIERSDGACVTTSPGDQLLISVDATFKDTAGSDYVAMGVWLRRGMDVYLLDQVHDRLDFTATCQRLAALAAKWPQAVLKVIEDKANGPAIIAHLRNTIPGLVPEEPQGGKIARANAVTPVCEAGQVHLPDPALAPWVGGMLDELTAFPNAKHDDRVDQLTQAVNRLLIQPLLAGDTGQLQPDEFDQLDDDGYLYSPY